MKSSNIFTILMAVLILFVAGCTKSPCDVAQAYSDAISDGNLKKANKYSIPRLHNTNKHMIEAIEKFDIDLNACFVDEMILGDTAIVTTEDGSKAVLIYVDDEWKVAEY